MDPAMIFGRSDFVSVHSLKPPFARLFIIDCAAFVHFEQASIHGGLASLILLHLIEEFLGSFSQIGEERVVAEDSVTDLASLEMLFWRRVNQREVRRREVVQQATPQLVELSACGAYAARKYSVIKATNRSPTLSVA
jgi:hypothetical protein